MKKLYFIISVLCMMLCASCEKENRWPDNPDSSVYIVQYGYTSNTVWNVDGGSFTSIIGINCGGVRPANQNDDITVNFAIDKAMVDAYNADITNEFSGQLEMVPEDCFTIDGNSVTIGKGEVSGSIKVKFNVTQMLAKCDFVNRKYAIPVKLVSTSSHKISETEAFTEALYAISVDTPRFYFYCNAEGVTLNSVKVLAGGKNQVRYQIAGLGVPDGNYKVSVAYDPDALKKDYSGELPLPENSFKIDEASLQYRNEHNRAELVVTYDPSSLEYLKTYYLPISVVSGGPYGADADMKTLFVKVDLMNMYEKAYSSKITVVDSGSGRSGGYSAKKSPTSFADDMIELQMCCNNTIAGAKSSQLASTTYNNKYMRLKVIPTSDIHHYNVELFIVTDKSKKNNSPDTLELDPDEDSYYDADMERFCLHYRWKHTDGNWMNVTEYIQAN